MVLQLRLPFSHLAWRNRLRRLHVHDGIAREEVSRSQQKRHHLCGHHREVLWRGDVGDTECVPEDNVFVLDLLASIADPVQKTQRRIARSLRDVATCGPELIVAV